MRILQSAILYINFVMICLQHGSEASQTSHDGDIPELETVIETAERACSSIDTVDSMDNAGQQVLNGKSLGAPVQVGEFRSIKNLKTIRGISLKRDANDDDLAVLAKLPELRYVNAAYCYYITDKGISSLEHHPNLRIIELYRNEPCEHPYQLPEGFILSQKPNLTENTLRSLATIPHLHSLAINENRFTIAGVRHLYRCKELKHLQLRGNKLSDAELQEVGSELDKCDVQTQ